MNTKNIVEAKSMIEWLCLIAHEFINNKDLTIDTGLIDLLYPKYYYIESNDKIIAIPKKLHNWKSIKDFGLDISDAEYDLIAFIARNCEKLDKIYKLKAFI